MTCQVLPAAQDTYIIFDLLQENSLIFSFHEFVSDKVMPLSLSVTRLMDGCLCLALISKWHVLGDWFPIQKSTSFFYPSRQKHHSALNQVYLQPFKIYTCFLAEDFFKKSMTQKGPLALKRQIKYLNLSSTDLMTSIVLLLKSCVYWFVCFFNQKFCKFGSSGRKYISSEEWLLQRINSLNLMRGLWKKQIKTTQFENQKHNCFPSSDLFPYFISTELIDQLMLRYQIKFVKRLPRAVPIYKLRYRLTSACLILTVRNGISN